MEKEEQSSNAQVVLHDDCESLMRYKAKKGK